MLTSTTDVKELIPQFYHPPSAAFLLNGRSLDLGVRQVPHSHALLLSLFRSLSAPPNPHPTPP